MASIIDTRVASKYFTDIPTIKYAELNRKAWLYRAATIVAIVAAGLIGAGCTAIFLTGITLTGVGPYALFGAVFSTPLLMMLSTHCHQIAHKAKQLANDEMLIDTDFKEISEWDTAKIEDFFHAYNIPIPPDEDLRDRLLLIARFHSSQKKASAFFFLALRHLNKYAEGSTLPEQIEARKDANTPEKVDTSDDLAYDSCEIGFNALDTGVFPAFLKSALMLQLISDPYQQLEISSIGQLKQKTMMRRYAARLIYNDDVYLEFYDKSRPPLNCGEIENYFINNRIAALRQRMFDPLNLDTDNSILLAADNFDPAIRMNIDIVLQPDTEFTG